MEKETHKPKQQGRQLNPPPPTPYKGPSDDDTKPRKTKLSPSLFYRPIGGEPNGDYGYVNQHGILFPVGYKFKGGHVSWSDVVLRQCPRCGTYLSSTDSVKGVCSNHNCGYSAIEALEEISEI